MSILAAEKYSKDLVKQYISIPVINEKQV